VAGLDAKEAILRMTVDAKDQQSGQTATMAMTNDMWMVPEVPGYDQVRDFYKRFGEKMGDMFSGATSPFASAMASQPGMTAGMSDMVKEMQKLQGVPVSQVMRMGMAPNGKPLPAASEAPLPQSKGPNMGDVASNAADNAANSAANTATSNAENSAGSHMGSFGGVASSLGNLGGLGFHKKKPAAPRVATPAAGAPTDYSVLMESTTETTGFSSAPVDAAAFAIPAGYAKVANDYQKGK
jgi:hypothetical protein